MTTMTAGRRALIALLQRTKGHFVAARCRVSPQAVSHWLSGTTKPSPEARLLLEQNYGVPRDDWERENEPGRGRTSAVSATGLPRPRPRA